jgi:hypothetical protein
MPLDVVRFTLPWTVHLSLWPGLELEPRLSFNQARTLHYRHLYISLQVLTRDVRSNDALLLAGLYRRDIIRPCRGSYELRILVKLALFRQKRE